MSLQSMRKIIKTVNKFHTQVGANTVVTSAAIGGTYVTSAYADVTFAKSS